MNDRTLLRSSAEGTSVDDERRPDALPEEEADRLFDEQMMRSANIHNRQRGGAVPLHRASPNAMKFRLRNGHDWNL